jgi:RHS repeat-associated protein
MPAACINTLRHSVFLIFLAVCSALGTLLLSTAPAYAVSSILKPPPDPQCGVSLSCSLPTFIPPTPMSCGPPLGGMPCGSGVNLGPGNPINLITGNKYQREEDLAPLPGMLGLEIVRYYNSAYSSPGVATGILGHGWKLSYETALYTIGNTVQIMQADGSRVIFNRDPTHPSTCSSADPADGMLTIAHNPRGDTFNWKLTNGRILQFNHSGQLVQIAAPTGEFVSLQHDRRGMLVQVTDPQGRQLNLQYPSRLEASKEHNRFQGVSAISSPVGTFAYTYGSPLPKGSTQPATSVLANLVDVRYPAIDANTNVIESRHYHYEEPLHPTFLTGISSVSSVTTTNAPTANTGPTSTQRLSTYLYNRDGHAVLTVRGTPARLQTGVDGMPLQPARLVEGTGIGQVTLDYTTPGTTILTNSLGQITTYRHAIVGGQYRLLEARGAGCSTCGESNVRYGYDQLGRLVNITKLNADGQPIHTTLTKHDAIGRVVQTSSVEYMNGKPAPAQLQARTTYDNQDDGTPQISPTTIIRPSVVAGKERITHIAYNAAGQPLSITDSGWSPISDAESTANAGNAGNAANTTSSQPIVRTTRYGYTQINGRTLLTQIDGPLPNGPHNDASDSDITQLQWDQAGNYVVATTTPGNVRHTLQHDEIGRVTQVAQVTQGAFALINETILTYDNRSRIVAINDHGQQQRMRYDARNNPVETGIADGTTYHAIARAEFDIAGRHLWTALATGEIERNRYDNESRLIETTTQNGSKQSGHQRIKRYQYDDLHGLIKITDAAGAIRYQEQHRDSERNIAERDIRDQKIKEQEIKDDFGNTVAIRNPDSGEQRRQFDAAGRLIASSDALGNHATYQYDLEGRILRQVVYDIHTTNPQQKQVTTSWEYAGSQLVAVHHPDQTERYRYDASQRRIAKDVTLTIAGRPVTYRTQYQTNQQGELSAITLADGSTLAYQRDHHGQVTGLTRSLIQTPSLQWLQPAHTLIDQITRDSIDIDHLRYGNQIEARYQRSREGVLARIVYRRDGERFNASQQQAALTWPGIESAQAATSEIPTTLATPIADAVPNTASESAPAPAPAPPLPGAFGLPADSQAFIDHRYLWDEQGNLLYTQSKDNVKQYAYDEANRLIVTAKIPAPATTAVSSNKPDYSRYFYDRLDNRLLGQEGISDQADLSSHTLKSVYADDSSQWLGDSPVSNEANNAANNAANNKYDATGQPITLGRRRFEWNALGQLTAVYQAEQLLARYRYNHRGERISKTVAGHTTYFLYEGRQLAAELDERGHVTRLYIYLADRPVAIIDSPEGITASMPASSQPRQITADLGKVIGRWFTNKESIAYLHNNHLGATELITNDHGEPIWRTDYAAFGKTTPVAIQSTQTKQASNTPFKFNLRLPGQFEDVETGLYYNDHRYYDPTRGQYLTPDPLGLRGGINGYAYTDGNPLKYVDPSGLILFAFDGTNNSNPPPVNSNGNSDDFSNVYKFYLAYDATKNGPAWYMNGIGRDDYASGIVAPIGDAINASTARARINSMLLRFDQFMRKSDFTAKPDVFIDIVGFSRGAAMARDFSNQVAQKMRDNIYANTGACITLRFIGLWDTVAQVGLNGAANLFFDLTIPPEARHVFQAVALNEHRYWFPVESIATGVQRGFIGSHADIGGSYGTGDLSDVALNWIVQQAKNSGLLMKEWDDVRHAEWGQVTNPVLHDKNDESMDREFCLRARMTIFELNCRPLRKAKPGGMTWLDTQSGNLITRYDKPLLDADGQSKIIGIVNMNEYNAWLRKNYSWSMK